ncbi:MAG: hypothetical protein ACRD7E_30320 [Bryobacteraceae bacterium]
MQAFQKQATSTFEFRALGSRPTYEQIVRRTAESLKLSTVPPDTPVLERRIVRHLWHLVWDNMSPQQKAEFDRKLKDAARRWMDGKSLTGAALTGAGLLAAQLSGFGIYLLASSTLAAITAGIGITLPFAAYATMSSIVATVIGPVGWFTLVLYAAHKLTGPNYQKVASGIVMVHCIRARIESERKPIAMPAEQMNLFPILVAGSLATAALIGMWLLTR